MAKLEDPFNNPFRGLEKTLRKRVRASTTPTHLPSTKSKGPTPAPKEPPAATPREPSDAELFLQSMEGVSPIDQSRGTVPVPRGDTSEVRRPRPSEDEEVYEELMDLVEGRTHFDISDSDEFIEGGVTGLDRRILQRLKRGEYTHRRFLDLHGLTKDVAKDAVEAFIIESRESSQRCVLLVHGRGRNSKDNIPVLKEALRTWLARGRIGRHVLAFCTARPHDGGAGAMYVLLRR